MLFGVLSYSDINCLAMNVYHEARSEPLHGQHAVVHVTLNRVKDRRFPNKICDVVYQRKQFSWTSDKKSDTPKEKQSFAMVQKTVQEALKQKDVTKGAVFYHREDIKPYWSKAYKKTVKIGRHIFYRRT